MLLRIMNDENYSEGVQHRCFVNRKHIEPLSTSILNIHDFMSCYKQTCTPNLKISKGQKIETNVEL